MPAYFPIFEEVRQLVDARAKRRAAAEIMNENVFSQAQEQATKRKKKRTRKQKRIRFFLFLILAMVVISAATIIKNNVTDYLDKQKMGHPGDISEVDDSKKSVPKEEILISPMTVHIFNCGMGDMILVDKEDKEILIDCGGKVSKLDKYVDEPIEGFINTAAVETRTKNTAELFDTYEVLKSIGLENKDFSNFEEGDHQIFDMGDGMSVYVKKLVSRKSSPSLACIISDGKRQIVIEGAIDEDKETLLFAKREGYKENIEYVVAGNNGGAPALNVLRESSSGFDPIISCSNPKKNNGEYPSKENIEYMENHTVYTTYQNGEITITFIDGDMEIKTQKEAKH